MNLKHNVQKYSKNWKNLETTLARREKMDKEEEYEELDKEVTEELLAIDEMLNETVQRCIKRESDDVCASMTFKIPAFVYSDNINELKDKLLRIKELSKEFSLSELNDNEIEMAITSLNEFESSYEKEFDNWNKIEDLRCGLDMSLADIETSPTTERYRR